MVIARAPLHQDETRVFASGSNAPFIARPAAVRDQETQSLFPTWLEVAVPDDGRRSAGQHLQGIP
jgi:hypothetical protein